ncbi:hypothetical protein BD410DRAFT_610093 [Rickenella mellea]|uniref:Uncharacterized protein n=1 Tax=Rickenella mellea TaxID=50990 RepID=A0A4Y7QF72_9AGAM|nr:hypothetical protein BD410DRAFT_610093 [Rickenella mellea]
MFTQSLVAALVLALSCTQALAKPILYTAGHVKRTGVSMVANQPKYGVSFNNYGGYQSMSNFDDFYGYGNFDQREQTTVIKDKVVVCHSEKIEIIQQKLVILREMAKRIITEQICEVEVQTIVIKQFSSQMDNFHKDVNRKSGRQVSYDEDTSNKISQILGSDGQVSRSDLGFSGQDVGKGSINVQGGNWDNNNSPSRVLNANGMADQAVGKNQHKN